jgi:prepilin-type N-terminal cleavage/methylation domain-containing protein
MQRVFGPISTFTQKPRLSRVSGDLADRPAPASRQRGFTLTEVLVGMAVFVIGFAAVAAILPIGMRLQRQTQSEMLSRTVARQAESTILATPISNEDIAVAYFNASGFSSGTPVSNIDDSTTDLSPIHDVVDQSESSQPFIWPLSSRIYPSSYSFPPAGMDNEGGITNSNTFDPNQLGKYIWIPMARDRDSSSQGQDWQVLVFVLKRSDDASYPDGVYGNSKSVGPTGEQRPIPGISSVALADPSAGQGNPITNETDAIAGDKADTFRLDPGFSGIQNQFSAGDWIADDLGNRYQISRVNVDANSLTVGSRVQPGVTGIWYAPPPTDGGESPARRIVVIPGTELFD